MNMVSSLLLAEAQDRKPCSLEQLFNNQSQVVIISMSRLDSTLHLLSSKDLVPKQTVAMDAIKFSLVEINLEFNLEQFRSINKILLRLFE